MFKLCRSSWLLFEVDKYLSANLNSILCAALSAKPAAFCGYLVVVAAAALGRQFWAARIGFEGSAARAQFGRGLCKISPRVCWRTTSAAFFLFVLFISRPIVCLCLCAAKVFWLFSFIKISFENQPKCCHNPCWPFVLPAFWMQAFSLATWTNISVSKTLPRWT